MVDGYELYVELFEIADNLQHLAEKADDDIVKNTIEAIEHSANEVGRSFSGSWLGYHAYVYYENFQSPPPGAHFSQEWGLYETFSDGTRGNWREYNPEYVKKYILDKVENPDLDNPQRIAKSVGINFEKYKADIESILNLIVGKESDEFLLEALEEIKKVKILSFTQVINEMHSRGQFMTRDTLALGQGTKIPPHSAILAEIYGIRHIFGVCFLAANIARRSASHLERQIKKKQKSERVGTNIFIGHGRSAAWHELKDFVHERLKLPYDEFNRVPVAGVTNIARLSEMLDAAIIAFLVMTAEDETVGGSQQARMNVIHEVGLFQGRLGFDRAIILLEEGCTEFSNIQGLGQIRFPKNNIKACFEDVRAILEEKEIISRPQ